MKVVLVTFLFEPELGGGAAQVVTSLARGLVRTGNEVTVITSAPVLRPQVEWKEGIKVIRFNPRNLYWVYDKDTQPAYRKVLWQLIDVWNPFVYRAVRGFLEAEKPDVVHVHKLRGLSPSVWAAAKAAGVKILVHTCHDYELLSPEGQLSTRIGKLAERRAVVMRPYQALRVSFSDAVQLASGPSQYVLEMHTKMGFFRHACVKVIPNSHGLSLADLHGLCVSGDTLAGNPLRLLYLGRLVPEKGIDLLCQAMEQNEYKLPGLALDVAGAGPLGPILQKRYSGSSNIIIHGAVYGAEKKRLLANCDLLVLPSLVPETFGIVIAEAFAYGKPVLASRIGAVTELIREGETGFLVTPGDLSELVHALGEIAAHSEKLPFMRSACQSVAERFTLETFFESYMKFYQNCVDSYPNK